MNIRCPRCGEPGVTVTVKTSVAEYGDCVDLVCHECGFETERLLRRELPFLIATAMGKDCVECGHELEVMHTMRIEDDGSLFVDLYCPCCMTMQDSGEEGFLEHYDIHTNGLFTEVRVR